MSTSAKNNCQADIIKTKKAIDKKTIAFFMCY